MSPRVLVALLPLILLAGCDRWSEARITESKRRGDVVCRAIEAFHVRTGKFPNQLAQLQPDFLQEVPQPTAGYRTWDYSVIDGGSSYHLQVVDSEFGPILQAVAGRWEYLSENSK
jgi:hypothetical protein